LRSLTMPLIEEMDLEVETLDSIEGLQVAGGARHERFAETVPALRLAIAAAMGPRGAEDAGDAASLAKVAAAGVLLTGLAWIAHTLWPGSDGSSERPVAIATASAPAVPVTPLLEPRDAPRPTRQSPVPAPDPQPAVAPLPPVSTTGTTGNGQPP